MLSDDSEGEPGVVLWAPMKIERRWKKDPITGAFPIRPDRQRGWVGPIALALSMAFAAPAAASVQEHPVSYSRDIRGVLSNRCFVCHGQDESTREANLRLDHFEFATRERRGGAAIVPGNSAQSELIRRITADDPDDRMPPSGGRHEALSPEQVELFRRWIDEGATYEEHWAFAAPSRPILEGEGRHPIDAFVHRRLEAEGLTPSPPEQPELLLRRLFLDLTGLPATPEEVDAYLAERAAGDPQEVWLSWIGKIFNEEPYKTRYAERMTSPWLDQARYADTNGIHMDAGRQIWPWRDWVLRAYRANMPFDQFVKEQLAGDLFPEATQDQKVASGFNRNHIMTDEGGAIDAEYLVEYAADRAETTATVFLGLTVACARCHDHKFDPISQEDYFGLFAFYASNEEPGLYSQQPNPMRAMEPFMAVPSPQQTALKQQLEAEVLAIEEQLATPSQADRDGLKQFLGSFSDELGIHWADTEITGLESSAGSTLQVTEWGTVLASGTNPERDEYEIHLRTDAQDLRLIQLDVLKHASLPHGLPGRAVNGNAVLSGLRVEAISLQDPAVRRAVPIDWTWQSGAQADADWNIQRVFDGRANFGWAIGAHKSPSELVALLLADEGFGYVGGTEVVVTLEFNSHYANHSFGHVRLGLGSLDAAAAEQLPVSLGAWYHAGPFTSTSGESLYATKFAPETEEYDLEASFALEGEGSRSWVYRAEFADETLNELGAGVNVHYVSREIYSPTARSLEISIGSDDGFEILLNGESVLAQEIARGVAADQDRLTLELQAGRNVLIFKVINTGGAAGFYFKALQSEELLSEELLCAAVNASALADHGAALGRRATHAWRLSRSPEYGAGQEQLALIDGRLTTLAQETPSTMVMRERAMPRETFILTRGQYDKPDKERPVLPGIPGMFGELTTGPGLDGGPTRRATRLDLAEWLVSEENPLVARVAVNRLWQMIFGTGLVATSGDFGYQGDWPSHPDLLDWLAVDFRENGWDVQRLLTLMLSSETYQQSSHIRAEVLQVDPENRTLAHFPRRRLDAERLRDQALFVSGLLEEELGGPSVKPYQPAGLWREVAMPQSNTRTYEPGEGSDFWRRSLYTYWKRACPPPSLMSFDAPTREACVTQRAVTNTPLQALVLWNDEQFMEAARVLGERTLSAGLSVEEGLVSMFRRCTGRVPTDHELGLLSSGLESFRERYKQSPEDAAELVAVGMSMRQEGLEDSELAAWTMLASTLLNLHATITRG